MMLQDSLVVLDFETTGLSPERGDRITEVGLVRIEHGEITDRFQSLVNCGVRVPSFVRCGCLAACIPSSRVMRWVRWHMRCSSGIAVPRIARRLMPR